VCCATGATAQRQAAIAACPNAPGSAVQNLLLHKESGKTTFSNSHFEKDMMK
jgi:hypothetical protein